ncbi:MAG: BrnA antitoxin family protein [Candidatus Binatus sp.]|uniref:BrnA antitoxin family protein n=1 Tax=Candidatus Binatus sp. TaxID=2811406 RepID=UPI00271DEC2B|nr:BrnA antitoxin family protein [Candidatus Binatus sp.]MDO8433392.1 BrnA antitoxin family protein [Candidatus Binatus sp.]
MNRKIPKFKSEAEERKFWSSHDSVDYIDWRRGKRAVLSDLRPSAHAISIRLPQAMIDELKLIANKRDVPYQSLLKIFIAERLQQERQSQHALKETAFRYRK